jgi:hypothetical protein
MTERVKASDRPKTPCDGRENWEFESVRCRSDLTDTVSSSLHIDASLLVLWVDGVPSGQKVALSLEQRRPAFQASALPTLICGRNAAPAVASRLILLHSPTSDRCRSQLREVPSQATMARMSMDPLTVPSDLLDQVRSVGRILSGQFGYWTGLARPSKLLAPAEVPRIRSVSPQRAAFS